MATGRVEHKNEIFLNGYHFPIVDGVTRQVANQFAEKTVIGDFSEASDPFLSAVTWSDFRGGMARHVMDLKNPEHFTQFWDGNINNEFPGHAWAQQRPGFSIGHGTKFGDSAGTTIASNFESLFFGAYCSDSITTPTFFNIYDAASENSDSAFGVFRFSDSGLRRVYQPTDRPTDMKAGVVGANRILAVAEGNRIAWTRNNVADSVWFTDSTENIKHVAFWRELLWGMNASGELFFTPDASSSTLTWTQVTKASITSSETVTDLLSAPIPSPGNKESLFLVRQDGFDIYDNATEQFNHVLTLPTSSLGGMDMAEWNGALYYPYGLSLFRVESTPNITIVEDIGFTARDGVDSAYAGYIKSVGATPRQLFITVQPNSSNTGKNAAYVRSNVSGWTRFAESSGSSVSPTARLYAGSTPAGLNTTAYSFLPGWGVADSAGLLNGLSIYPLRLTGENQVLSPVFYFGHDGYVITPWVRADANQDWVALKLSADVTLTRNPAASAHSSFFVDYGLDFTDSVWTVAMSIVKSNTADFTGKIEVTLPSSTEPVGVPFSALRLRARFETDSEYTAFDLNRLSVVFEKRPKLRYAFSFDIDLRKPYKGHSVKEMREFIDEFLMQRTLAEFTYHADDPGGGHTYYVRAINPVSQEATGQVERDFVRMSVMELV